MARQPPGGRPKITREETAQWLQERGLDGKTNVRKAVEGVGAVAQGGTKSSAQALKTLHDMLGDDNDQKPGSVNTAHLNMNILAAMERLATSEK